MGAALGQALGFLGGRYAGNAIRQWQHDQRLHQQAQDLNGVLTSVAGAAGAPAVPNPGGGGPSGAPAPPGVDLNAERAAVDRLAQGGTPFAHVFGNLNDQQRTDLTQALLRGGTKPSDLVSLMVPPTPKFQTETVGNRLYAFNPSTGQFRQGPAAPSDLTPKKQMVREYNKLQNGAITPGEFQKRRRLLLADQNNSGSDLLDGNGNVKVKASNAMRRMIADQVGVGINPQTGEFTGSPEKRHLAGNALKTAEGMIRGRQVHGAGTAVLNALDQLHGQPGGASGQDTVQVPLPESTRKNLLTQNANIDRILAQGQNIADSVAQSTGIVSNGKALLDATVGQLTSALGGSGSLFPDTQESRQQLRMFNQQVKRAIVNNPRYPVAEQQMVQRMLPDPQSWFTNPHTALQNFQQLMHHLSQVRTQNEQQLQGNSASAAGAASGQDGGASSAMGGTDHVQGAVTGQPSPAAPGAPNTHQAGPGAAPQWSPDQQQTINNAKQAIQSGASRQGVIQKMLSNGWTQQQINDAGL